ncbi:MAG TPA: SDR family NAD(P)-dependent oxidoreductase, partial [Acidimicrobiales bacterium]|nr:SDR family NAD(P)-dependent oxidoreductase [Acidimicrobiales bacterium]
MTQPVYDFSERVVVITGGSRGVGAGIVAAFAGAGAHVVTCGRHETEVEGALFMTADVRKPADAERVVAKAVAHFGRLDVLVNNAGGAPYAMAAEQSPRFVEAVVNLNLLAPLWCAQS